MSDPVYALVWPRSLFEWEAHRLLEMQLADGWVEKLEHLLNEAYHDEEVARTFMAMHPRPVVSVFDKSPAVLLTIAEARKWLTALLADESKLKQYQPPVYWAERAGLSPEAARTGDLTFVIDDYFDLLDRLQETGYFPKALPKECPDEWTQPEEVRNRIRRATKLDLPWPMSSADRHNLSEAAFYTLVEYFHDQAQRPRSTYHHNFSDCGTHYQDHNIQSGQSVYRWQVNDLFQTHSLPLRLGNTGAELGRLVRHFAFPLDDLAASEVVGRAEDQHDEVAHAVRLFRSRTATITDKRAAVVMLYGELEPRRRSLEKNVSKKDEADLFRIANQFNIRHRDKSQQIDYGEEFLDWTFWTCLATIRLLDDLSKRPALSR